MKNEKTFYVYIMASRRNGTLYIGMTSDLLGRVWQHKNGVTKGFTGKYKVHRLVYYEIHDTAETAATRERQMKEWQRAWKIRRIEEINPAWDDLYEGITGSRPAPG